MRAAGLSVETAKVVVNYGGMELLDLLVGIEGRLVEMRAACGHWTDREWLFGKGTTYRVSTVCCVWV